MKHLSFLACACVALLSSCQSVEQPYHSGSVAEARAYVKRAVETGVTYKAAEPVVLAEQSAGRPAEGKFDPQKIESFVRKFAAAHPGLVKINLAASSGQISEKDREFYTTVMKNQEEREEEQKKELMQANMANLNQSSMSNTQSSSYRMNSALMQATPTSGYSGYGTGYGGRSF